MSRDIVTKVRLDKLDKEIKEMEDLMLEGDKPTQSNEPEIESTEEIEGKKTTEEQQIGVEQEADSSKDTVDYWKERTRVAEQRYNISKSKYDQNIVGAKKDIASLRLVIAEKDKLLIERKKVDTQESLDKVFTKEVTDILGEDVVESLKTIAKTSQEEAAEAKSKVAELESNMAQKDIQTTVEQEQGSFLSNLEKLVPDYENLNIDEGFLGFLDALDVTGTPRFNRLRAAQEAGNVEGVAYFFKAYKASQEQSTDKPKSKDSITRRISPDSKAAPIEETTKTDKKPMVTKEFMDNHNKKIRLKQYKSRAEIEAVDNIINEAFLEGRIEI